MDWQLSRFTALTPDASADGRNFLLESGLQAHPEVVEGWLTGEEGTWGVRGSEKDGRE